MAFCKRCGAYIPIDETACPACGYDPEAEARKEQEEKEAREQAEREARERAAAEERRKAEQQRTWAAEEMRREREARRREEQRQKWQQGFNGGGAAQSQYTSQRTGQSTGTQTQYTSQRTGENWVPPWSAQQTGQQSQSSQQYYQYAQQQHYADMRQQAKESADNQKLSVLSYLGPLLFVPLFTRSNDDFARFHSNQGLVLFLFNALASMVFAGSEMLGAAAGVFSLYCIVKGIGNVLKGKKEPLPLIGKIKLLK